MREKKVIYKVSFENFQIAKEKNNLYNSVNEWKRINFLNCWQ